jgi:hypothetical protein
MFKETGTAIMTFIGLILLVIIGVVVISSNPKVKGFFAKQRSKRTDTTQELETEEKAV